MKTLVIHPWDPTTRELTKIYRNTDAELLTKKGFLYKDVADKLKNNHYDRIYLLGHGNPFGLMDMKTGEYVFDGRMYKRFIENTDTELICIFCDADAFVSLNRIPNAFCTGMFISEPREAKAYSLDESAETIQRGFDLFSKTIHELFNSPIDQFRKYISENYVGEDTVTKFNRKEMCIFD